MKLAFLGALILTSSSATSQVCSTNAEAVALGLATPGANGFPQLVLRGAPILGGPLELRVENGQPNGLGVFAHGPATAPLFLPAFGATFYPSGPLTVSTFPFDTNGSASVVSLLPVSASLCGTQATGQAASLDAVAMGGFAFTKALALTLGARVPGDLFATRRLQPSDQPSGLLFEDLNLDGHADVAVYRYFVHSDDELSVFLGMEAGGFGNEKRMVLGGDISDIEAADLGAGPAPELVCLDGASDRVGVSIGLGGGDFAAPVWFATGDEPSDATIADVDRDGDLDVIVVNKRDDTFSVHRGRGNGTLFPRVTYPTLGDPVSIVTGDLNNDGRLDLVISGFVAPFPITTHLGLANGGFAGRSWTGSGQSTSLKIEDINGDGLPDLLAAKSSPTWRAGAGDGTFGPEVPLVPGPGESIDVGHLDGDGILDLAVAEFFSGHVRTYTGNGDGTFALQSAFPVYRPKNIAFGDSDADGQADLAFITGQQDGGVVVAGGLGDGRMSWPELLSVTAPSFATPREVELADYDGDQDLDVLSLAGLSLQLFRGNGAGAFASPESYPTGTDPRSITTTDIDGDGRLDVIVARGNAITVRLGLLGGGFDVGVSYSGCSSPADVTTADLNGDGAPDVISICSTGEVWPYLNDGNGTLTGTTPIGITPFPATIAAGDIDSDGVDDLIAGYLANYTLVLRGLGDGTFAPALVTDVLGRALFEDLDLDGNLDIVAASLADNIGVALGNGNGTFASARTYQTIPSTRAIAVQDMDGDFIPDVLVTGSEGALEVLRGLGGGVFSVGKAFVAVQSTSIFSGTIALGDIDGDTIPDVIVPGDKAGGLSVHKNLLLGR